MESRVKPSILPGFMELLPEEERIFQDMQQKIRNVYESFGCLPMDTPIIEKSEVLLAKSQGETSKQIYRFTKEDKDMTLRYDLTVPFARYVAMHSENLAFPFRRYQIGKVYRGERNQKGRYREFYQCDVDIVGKETLDISNDAMVLYMVSEAFKAIGLENYYFALSNRKLIKGLLAFWKVETQEEVILGIMDKFYKLKLETFKEMLEEVVEEKIAKELIQLLTMVKDTKEVLRCLESYQGENELFDEGLKEIQEVIEILKVLEVPVKNYQLDLSIIRGLDYYTGTVFETFLQGAENYGSICSGGRYDQLSSCFTKENYPGVGISIGLTRLFSVLKEIGFIQQYPLKPVGEYMILSLGNTNRYALKVYQKLSALGYRVGLNLEESKLKKKMSYANKLQVPRVIIVGDDEMKREEVLVKDMFSGEQKSYRIEELNKIQV